MASSDYYSRLARTLWEAAGRPGVAGIMDATLLDPRAPPSESERVVREAAGLGAYCALVPPSHVPVVSRLAGELGVRLCSVAGFPYGYQPAPAKAAEVEWLSGQGVAEVDYVIDVGRAAAGDIEYVESEIAEAVDAARRHGARIKVIVEAPLIGREELGAVVRAAARTGAFMVKTSTGVLSKGGDPATVSRLASIAAGWGMPVKAAGGIRSLADALAAVVAGASRIGSSSYSRIISEASALLG